MLPLTLEKLKKDSRRLSHNIQRMRKKGKETAACKLLNKKALIDAQINSIIEEEYHPVYEFVTQQNNYMPRIN